MITTTRLAGAERLTGLQLRYQLCVCLLDARTEWWIRTHADARRRAVVAPTPAQPDAEAHEVSSPDTARH
jgi:hypothetical protein